MKEISAEEIQKHKQIGEWEKDFDDKFFPDEKYKYVSDEIKSFISELLVERERKAVEEYKTGLKEKCVAGDKCSIGCNE